MIERSASECLCGLKHKRGRNKELNRKEKKISLGDRGVHGDDKVTDVMSEQRAKRGHKNGPFTRLQTIIRQDNA